MLVCGSAYMNLPVSHLSGQPDIRYRWSFKPGATALTRHLFSSGASYHEIKAAAVAYIRRAVYSEGAYAAAQHHRSASSSRTLEAAAWTILDQPIDAWSTISDATLLQPLHWPGGFMPATPFHQWVRNLFYRGYQDAKGQFARDVGLNLDQHVADLEAFFHATAAFARVPALGDIHAEPNAWPGAEIDPDLLVRLRRDHALLMAVVRAQMLGEYLRRRTRDPLHEYPRPAPARWRWQSSVCIEGLLQPAVNLSKLMTVKIDEKATPLTALSTAISSGRLYLDPRLHRWAMDIHRQLAPDLSRMPDRAAAEAMALSVVRDAAPLARLTASQIRAEFGKNDAVVRDFGVSAPIALSVLAIQLALLARHVVSHAFIRIPRALPNGARSKVMRITSVLKMMSRAGKEVGDAQANPDNKTGTKLLNKALEEIALPGKSVLLRHLSLQPSVRTDR
jgi:hypothetical protein